MPAILLEGDAPATATASGPGERYALGPTPTPPPPPHVPTPEVMIDLPEAYGTGRMFLTARDPHWLYAAWDLAAEQRQRHNSLSREGHLVVRTYMNEVGGRPVSETHVHPESTSWFIPVNMADTRYRAELGYYGGTGEWHGVTTSEATLTPPESSSFDAAVEFATIPPDVSLKKLLEVVREAILENVPLLEAVQQLRAEGWTGLPEIVPSAPPKWTPAQMRALGKLVRLDEARRVWMGSLEITEVIRRHLRQEISSGALAGAPGAGAEQGLGAAAISSPLGIEKRGMAGLKPFWLTINAELVLYGATEPDAKVVVGGRQIRLRPDGTFSFRCALPDGQYPLQVTATSADGEEGRGVQLEFARWTQFQGEVGAHEQDPKLMPPLESSFA